MMVSDEELVEEWKDIKGYEGLYQISSSGNIKVLKYKHCNRYKTFWVEKSKILKPWDNGNGYKVIALTKDGKRKNYYLHRLVAEHFIDNPGKKEQVNHIDYNKSNNTIDNLEWVSAKENTNHSKINFAKRHICKTNTGYRYITYRADKGLYRVIIDHKEKAFKILEDAVKYRDELIKNG